MLRASSDSGAVTAEFVILLPAVILVFTLLATAFHAELQLARLSEAAAWAARQAAWGSGQTNPPQGIAIRTETTTDRVCVTASVKNPPAWLATLKLEERVCLPKRGY